jgi:hypothetical protein
MWQVESYDRVARLWTHTENVAFKKENEDFISFLIH